MDSLPLIFIIAIRTGDSPIPSEASLLPISVDESCRGARPLAASLATATGWREGWGRRRRFNLTRLSKSSFTELDERERGEGRRVQKQNMGRPEGGSTNSSNIEYVMASRVWVVRK